MVLDDVKLKHLSSMSDKKQAQHPPYDFDDLVNGFSQS